MEKRKKNFLLHTDDKKNRLRKSIHNTYNIIKLDEIERYETCALSFQSFIGSSKIKWKMS